MPRDLLRQLLKEAVAATQPEINGEIISPFREEAFDVSGTRMPVADVRIGATIVGSVPIAAANQELREAVPGTPVRLQRSATGRLEITGRSQRGAGNTTNYALVLPTTTATLVSGEPIFTSSILLSGAVSGFFVRTTTLEELGTISGFGVTPLQALVLTDADGHVLRIL